MKCLYCYSDDHPWFNCRKKPEGWKPPKKSTAARKDVPTAAGSSQEPHSAEQPPLIRLGLEAGKSGGTGKGRKPRPVQLQAPPVDTKFDKVAYQRDYMRKYRAKRKAEK